MPQILVDTYDKLTPKSITDLIIEVWGRDKKGNPNKPGFHWSGISQYRERTKLAGQEAEELNLGAYSSLSPFVHSGAAPVIGREDEISLRIGRAYFVFALLAYRVIMQCSQALSLPLTPRFFETLLSIRNELHAL